MKKMMQLVSVFLMIALVTPITAAAQTRDNTRPSNSGSRPATSHSATNSRPSSSMPSVSPSRPGNSGHTTASRPTTPSVSTNNRPVNNGNNGNHNAAAPANRPGNNGNHNGWNNGNNGNHRPGNVNNNPGNLRPGYTGNTGSFRPGTSAPRPGSPAHQVPVRPYMPVYRPYVRPVPPSGWRPYHGCPTFSSILGITFGTALNLSVNALINAGYNVSSYGNNMVYLTSVPMFNLTWPNATLFYNNGALYGSEFVYSTPYYDMSRFNQLYNNLLGQYGQPVSVTNNAGSVSATWWGYNNGYITLNYYSDYAQNGTLRHYTTLSLGN